MMHSINAQGRILCVSQKWLDTLGYAEEEVIGRLSADFLSENSRRYAIENVLPEFFRTGNCSDIPYQFITKSGGIIDVLLSAMVERDEHGHVTHSIAVMQNVTSLNQVRLQLEKAKIHAESLLRTANVMVVELDPSGTFIRGNAEAERITGYSSEELQGVNWFAKIVPRDRYPEVWQEFARLLANQQVDAFENPILTKDGHERYVTWRNSIVTEGGKTVGTLSVGLDVTEHKQLEKRLFSSEAALKNAQSVAQIGSWTFEFGSNELTWSDQVFHILELDPLNTRPSKEAFLKMVLPEDHFEAKRTYKRALLSQRPYEFRYQLHFPDGSLKYAHQHTEITFDDKGEPIRVVGTLQDVTLSVLQEIAFQESEERFRTIADYTYDWEYWQGEGKEILYISPSCLRVTGYSQAEFIGNPNLLETIIHPDDAEAYRLNRSQIAANKENHLDFRITTKQGEQRWIAHGCRAVFTSKGLPNGRRVSNRDITDLKNAEQLAQKLAFFDALTGLPNRRMLLDRLEQSLSQARRFGRTMALMFIDLDSFKEVNDTHGHDVGDALLIEVAARFSRCIRAGDTVARTGGDEFIVILPELSMPSAATVIADKLLNSLSDPIDSLGQLLKMTASIGIATFAAGETDTAAELMKKADLAMYQAKRTGRNQWVVYGQAQ
jgi:diguanylate cyclase (GGDEF)-like protein/PAS domain S-box-containing protein